MKILSNFDTNKSHMLLQEAINENGKDKVIFVRRHFIYIVMRVLLPLVGWLLFVLLLLYLGYILMQGQGGFFSFVRWLLWSIIIITGLFFLKKSIKILIDYYMDFTIITPNDITCYNQNFLFHTSVRALEINKIKSIRVDKIGILKSIFNYGAIVFFAEGDQSGQMGDITLQYITNPDKLRDKIDDLVKKEAETHLATEHAMQKVAEKMVEDAHVHEITSPSPPNPTPDEQEAITDGRE